MVAIAPSRLKALESNIVAIERRLGVSGKAVGPVVDAANDNQLIPGNAKGKVIRVAFLPKGLHDGGNGWLYPTADMWEAHGIKPTWETHSKLAPVEKPIADIILSEAFRPLFDLGTFRFKGFKGGRGGAKSTAFAIVLLLLSRARKLRIVCARQFQVSIATSVKTILDDWIVKLGIEDEFKSTLTTITHIATGSEFHFIGLDRNPASIKSLEGADICWIEEAHSIVAGSLDILEPTIRNKLAEIWCSWNPEQPDDPIEAFLGGETPPPRSVLIEVSYLDNPHLFTETSLPESLAHAARGNVGRFNHIWLGAYKTHTDASVFDNWQIAQPEDLNFDPDLFQMVRGFDASNGGASPHALISAHVALKLKVIYIEQEAYGHHKLIDLTGLFDELNRPKHVTIRGDSAAPGILEFVRGHGYPIEAAKKGNDSIEAGVSWLQGFDVYISPKCPIIADEFKRLSYKVDKRTLKILDEIAPGNDHGLDALRYACEPLMDEFIQNADSGLGAMRLNFGRRYASA